MTDGSALDAEVPEDEVRGMVESLRPDWRVASIDPAAHGTDFVATLAVGTPDGPQRAVLKATTADLVDPRIARAEPRLLELVGAETPILVPAVYGYCDHHGTYPAPFHLMGYVEGRNYEDDVAALDPDARERIVRAAGRNLAALHSLDPPEGIGRVGVRDGGVTVLDTDEFSRYDDVREWLLNDCEDTLDALEDGGFFPDLADDPERFADLVGPLRNHFRATVPSLPPGDRPRYCHTDYRYGNLLVDPETGATNAVLDWANLSATDPVYNLANTESLLLSPDQDTPERTEELRTAFRSAYADAREDFAFDRSVRERMDVYHLFCRVKTMGCLPLWYEDTRERNRREAEHREFVEKYL